MENRLRRNSILSLNTERGKVEQKEVKKEVKEHFHKRFKESNFRRPKLDEVTFSQLSEEEKDNLEALFSIEKNQGGGIAK